MAKLTRFDDLALLVQTAGRAISQALEDGSVAGHKAGSWLAEDFNHHMKHAAEHFHFLLPCNYDPSRPLRAEEEDMITNLEHLICRLVMARAVRLRDKNQD